MPTEQRQAPRKILRAKAQMTVDGSAPVVARTFDIGAASVELILPEPLTVGQRAHVSFDMYFDGKSHPIAARATVSHCIFSHDGFKVGFTFASLDPVAAGIIARFLR